MKNIFIIAFLLLGFTALAQNPAKFRNGIDVTGQADITGTIILQPQGAPGSPVPGELYFDSVQNITFQWNGTEWKAIGKTELEAVTQAEYDALSVQEKAEFVGYIVEPGTGQGDASDITLVTTSFDNNLSGADTDVQLALNTLDNLIATGGGTGADVQQLTEAEYNALTQPQKDTLDADIIAPIGNAINAEGVGIADAGAIITATTVEGALAENRTAIDLNTVKETNATHTGDVTGDDVLTLAGDVVATNNIVDLTIVNADLADDTISEVKLDIFNAPTNDYYMKYSSTNGMTWALGSGGGDIYLHPNSDVAIDSIYVGTEAQIAARPLGTDVLSFATDASVELTDLTDVNTSTVTNRFFLIADGVDWESRAIVKADLPSVTYREAIAISDNTTALTTGVKMTWYSPPYAITITDAEASLLTAATGAELIIDIHDDGTTIMGTNKLDIEVSEFHTKDAVTQPAISAGSIAAGSKLEAEIDQIGSTIAGAGAIVYIYYTID